MMSFVSINLSEKSGDREVEQYKPEHHFEGENGTVFEI